MSRRTKILTLSVVAVLLVGGGTTAAVVVANYQKQAEAERTAALETRAEQAREEGRQRAARLEMIAQMEESITEDAAKKHSEGLLAERVEYSTCDPLGGGSVDDLTALTTTFTCLAVYKENDDGTSTGYSVSATINWTEESWQWQFGG